MKKGRAHKPISFMSSRVLQVVPNLGLSASEDTLSPGAGTQYAKSEGVDVSSTKVFEDAMTEDDGAPTMSDLKTIESHRRSLLLRTEFPVWRIILCWSGTCLSQIAADTLIWVSLCAYIAIRIYANAINYVPDSAAALSGSNNIDILGGFLSFFLVLFVNQTNGRFLDMYGFSKACSGRIQDLTGLAKSHLPSALAERLVRWVQPYV